MHGGVCVCGGRGASVCVCVCVNLYKINRLCREDQVIEIAQLGLVMSWLCQEHMSRWSVLLYADATSSLLCT